ncbi:trypsin, partial [Actinoplanes sp. NPDC026623]
MTDLLTRPTYTRDHAAAAPPLPPLPPHVVSHRGDGRRRWPRRVAGGAAVLALIAGGGTAGGL